MLETLSVKQKLIDLKSCVIIPTYNNDRTLEDVLQRVLKFTSDVIIVNDGSTDNTPSILQKYNHLQILTISRNTGKGNALRLPLNMPYNWDSDMPLPLIATVSISLKMFLCF